MRSIILVGALLLCLYSNAQTDYRFGYLPHVNFSIVLSDQWRLTSKTETRQIHISGPQGDLETDFSYERTDINVVVVRKTGERSTLGLGYLIRIQDGTLAHRVIQQYTVGAGHGRIRYAHRVTTDQTYRSFQSPSFRLRYRLSAEIPLNGDSLDEDEGYIRLYNEYLAQHQSGDTELETRVAALYGRMLTNDIRLETGPEYRASRFLMENTRHQLWMHLGLFFSF